MKPVHYSETELKLATQINTISKGSKVSEKIRQCQKATSFGLKYGTSKINVAIQSVHAKNTIEQMWKKFQKLQSQFPELTFLSAHENSTITGGTKEQQLEALNYITK